jgi:hypothetical protein
MVSRSDNGNDDSIFYARVLVDEALIIMVSSAVKHELQASAIENILA